MTRPFWGWPGWTIVRTFLGLYLAVSILFAVVFVGADALTAARSHVRVALPGEEQIPFLPAAVWVYMSIYLPLLAAPFILRTERELRALAASCAVVIVAAGLCFLAIPAALSYPRLPIPATLTGDVLRFADRLNLDDNLVPSLHVALSATSFGFYASHASLGGRALLAAWALAIGASTLLTHQHHVIDVLAGYALAAGVLAGWARMRR